MVELLIRYTLQIKFSAFYINFLKQFIKKLVRKIIIQFHHQKNPKKILIDHFLLFFISFCWEEIIERLVLDLRKLVTVLQIISEIFFRSVPQVFLFFEATILPCIGHVWACPSKQMKSTGISGWPEYFGMFNL